MSEQEIFEKLKDALGYRYLVTDFGETEVENLESYLQAIKFERQLEEEYVNEDIIRQQTYQEFIHYLSVEAIGDNTYIIEAFDDNDYNCFKGYLNVEKIIKDNNLYLRFEVDGTKLTADWEPAFNYGVWQTNGYSGDDYSGYLLFPTHTDNRYFCLKYSC